MQEVIARKFGVLHPDDGDRPGPDVETVMERNREANRILTGSSGRTCAARVDLQLPAAPPGPGAVLRELRDVAGRRLRHRPDSSARFRAALREKASARRPTIRTSGFARHPAAGQPIGIEDLQEAGSSASSARYIKKEEDGSYKSVAYLFPARAESKTHRPPALVEGSTIPEEGIEITASISPAPS